MKSPVSLFIKNAEDISDPNVRAQYGVFSGVVGILVNLILFAAKFVAGSLANSIAITADAFNNLSDAGSSVVTLVGFRMSSKPADKEHPFGHGRIEYISGLIVSFLILLVGFELFTSSVEKIIHPEEIQSSAWAIAVLIISIFGKLLLGLFYRRIGGKINSASLKASMTDSISDVCATAAVLISVVIFTLTSWNIDGVMGAIVAVFVFIAGIKACIETLNPLLGQAPDPHLVQRIKDGIMSYSGVLGFHDLIVHNYGPGHFLASVHVEVPAEADILQSHTLIDQIERELGESLDISIVIHMDPIVTNDERVDIAQKKVAAALRDIDAKLTFHDFRAVVCSDHMNVIFDVVVPFQYPIKDSVLKKMIVSHIRELYPEYCAVVTIDKSFI